MKKITALLLVLIFLIGAIPVFAATQREIWESSPGITCGITSNEIMFNKAVASGAARLYKLDSVGDRYYLGVVEDKHTDGGSNGKKKTSYLDYFSIFETDDGFIILGRVGVGNEYSWNGMEGVLDVSKNIDTEFYISRGYEAPYYIINPHDKYTYSGWDEYNDYIFIGSNGGIAKISDWKDYGQARFPMIYENKVCTGQNMYYSSGNSYYYYLSDGKTRATQIRVIGIKNGEIINVTSLASVAATSVTDANGFKVYNDGMSGNTLVESYYSIPDNSGRFFNYKYEYNSSTGKYTCVLKIYKNISGKMTEVQTETCETNLATVSNIYPYSISGIDESVYSTKGISAPVVRLGDLYVLKNGKMLRFTPDSTYNEYELCVYNNRLATIRTVANASYIYYPDETGYKQYWQRINYLDFTSSGIIPGEDMDMLVGLNTNLDGYYSNYYTFNQGNKVSSLNGATLKEWWPHTLNNKFSDGRYVAGRWVGMGNSMYEIWYDIYDKDGQLISTGASDFSTVASSSLYTTPLQAFVINDTKIILCLSSLDNDWFNEYYRAAVVTENDDGIIEVPQPIGKKNIVAPGSSETTPVTGTVDFTEENLSLGFNIKENIIGANKLTSGLREQVNSIQLDGITIVAKEGAVRGKWYTGITLPSYNKHDYSYSSGDVSIYFHSNGSTFNYSCSNPEKLIPGTYNNMYYVDGKSFYVRVNIIAPPTNDSATTVVF